LDKDVPKTMETKELTRAEEQLMQVLWKMDKAFVKEMIEHLPDPKPIYSTVSTIIRVLEAKGFVAYEAFGRTHRYYPLLSKEQYKKQEAEKLLTNYFDNSVQDMLSFFIKQENLQVKDVEDIERMIGNIKPKS
jgi:BlaI family penicillinase repressor